MEDTVKTDISIPIPYQKGILLFRFYYLFLEMNIKIRIVGLSFIGGFKMSIFKLGLL
jgi:hypothetical protein